MKGKTGIIFSVMVAFLVFFAVQSFAQMMGGRGGGGWGMGGSYGMMFNPSSIEIVKGEVAQVDQIIPLMGMSQGVHLTLRGADGEMISVHLGPAWFINNQDVTIESGDTIEVKGSRITFDGEPAIIAQEVRKGDEVLTLRDDNGFPAWSGWRRR